MTHDEIKINKMLLKASFVGNVELVKIALEKGAKINITDKCGWSALTFATVMDHLEVVKTLLENGADANKRDKGGDTAFDHALYVGHSEIAKMLSEHYVF